MNLIEIIKQTKEEVDNWQQIIKYGDNNDWEYKVINGYKK